MYGFSLTLTMRLGRVSIDRVGDQFIARNVPRTPLGNREGFNAKVEQLRAFLHMNWQVCVLANQTPPSANDNIAAWSTGTVYGFTEPARSKGPTQKQLVGGAWFGAEPDAEDFGIKATMTYDGARRLQPHTLAIGPFA